MVPLFVRSHYSLMRGTAPIRDLCRAAARMGYAALALTDRDNLYGLWTFLAACRAEGIRPLIGAEVTRPGPGPESGPGADHRAVCLAESLDGYRSLCRLLTRRHTDPGFCLKAAVAELSRGLTVLTADPDLLTAWHEAGVSVSGLMARRPLPHGHPLCRAARRLGVPMVAAPDSFFVHPRAAVLHRVLRAIAGNTSLSRLAPEDTAPAEAWLAPPAEYAHRFAVCPQALDDARAVAERLAFTGPAFGTVMPPWSDPGGRNAAAVLRDAAYAGAARRYGPDLPEPVVDRLEHELRIIADMGFPSYFLVVRDIVTRSPRICGRGSGAASLAAYCLGITNVCPVRHNLYFERFLNPGRTDPPDIDVDFAWDERDAVIRSVLDRFKGHAAMVASHILFQPRMAVRETARVFGLTDGEIGRVTRRLPGHWSADAADPDLMAEMRTRPRARGLELPPPWPEILKIASRLLGAPRRLSVHPGGVVITPDPIDTYAPVETAPKGVPVIQWDKDAAEDAGLVKIDLLGNRSLAVIRDAIAGLRENGRELDESRWEPEDDPDTQAAVAHGRTMGCFYIESPAMRLLQQKAGVGDFEHLVIHSSIIRPAANDCIREYVRRLHGEPWEPIHPLLGDVLDETFGIMVYQEDVSKAAVALAGFSHAEADRLRKIMSKKDRELLLKDFKQRFTEGALTRGVSPEQIAAVWDMILSFSGYSFCKPHSASYARVSFQAAWLKTHFPAEFIAGVISNQGGFYSTFAYVSEARRMGLTILPPDVGESGIRWIGRDKAVRVGLLSIKGLHASTQERIVRCRKDRPYRTIADFLDRVRPDESEARALIRCGALDRLSPGPCRAGLMWSLADWERKRRDGSPQPTLFDADAADAPTPRLPPEDLRARLRAEYDVLGFLCDRHPMTLFAHRLKGIARAADLGGRIGRTVTIAGWLITGKTVRTKHGDSMEFLTFEDETGLVETTFFPEVHRRFCHLLDWKRPYRISGKVESDWGAVTLTAAHVAPLAA